MSETIGFKRQIERERDDYEAMILGFCDSLYESLLDMETKEGDAVVTGLHEIIYGELNQDQDKPLLIN